MPVDVDARLRAEGLLRVTGPHAPDTVLRRLTSWSILTRWRGLEGDFRAPSLKSALRLAARAAARPRQRKSRKAVTGDVLGQLLSTCNRDRKVGLRDQALLLVASASGGRRRSEVAGLRVEDLRDEIQCHQIPRIRIRPRCPA